MKQTEDGHAGINGLSQGSKERSDGDPRLARAMEEYQALLRAGGKPDHGEFLARYPEVAGALADCLAGLDFLHVAAPDLSAPMVDGTPADGLEAGAPLGDFRLIREVGRGGMGVVYEAEQISMGRRVALKVLPFAAVMDPRQLQRFKNEARAAGSLQHPNIVPVYFVGSERGVHYFAMQFIEGQTLAALLQELRQPATPDRVADPAAATETAARQSTLPASTSVKGREYYRRVAEWGEKAAEALDHAHQTGIVHRDVKPVNLMLDVRGNLWVTDFGLSHVQQGEANLTMTGDLVGTLRYMSPEQALGKRVVIDHRTDVYSLGATLYELLTLRPAVEGADRQEVLRRIAFDEPVAPRKIDRGIPAELETIVLKAMEKNPQERYGTAQELADDLRHWLEDRPIRARRPSLTRRAARWARRHKPLVGAVLAVLLIAAVLGGGTWQWWAQKRVGAEGEGRAALREASGLLEEERWPEALSAARRAEGALAGVGADPDMRRQARTLIKDLEMAYRLQEARLLGAAVMKDGRYDSEATDAAYAAAFQEYGLDVDGFDLQAAAEQIRARPIHRQLVAALDDWAVIRRPLNAEGWKQRLAVARAVDPDAWRNRLRDSLESRDGKILEEVLAAHSAGDWPARTLQLLVSLASSKMPSSARVAALLAQAQQRHPEDFWINETLGRLASETQPPRLEESIRFHSIAVALRPHSPGAHHSLGLALADKRRLDEAIAEYREALRLMKDYAEAHCSLGTALMDNGRPDEANAEFREAIRLKKDDSDAHNNLGNALTMQGELEEAIAEYREAIRLKKDDPVPYSNLGMALMHTGQVMEGIAAFKEALRIKKDFHEAHFNLGIALVAKGQLEEAIAEYREAIRLKKDFAAAHINLGVALGNKGRLDEANAEFREAIRIKKDSPEAHNNLGAVLLGKGQLDDAIAEFREAIRLKKDYAQAHRFLARVRKMVQVRDRLSAVLLGKDQPKDAGERLGFADFCQQPFRQQYATAARFYEEAFTADPKLVEDPQLQHRYNAACAAALAGCGQGKDAADLSEKERAHLRTQAFDWLRADLDAWTALLKKDPAKTRPLIIQKMQHWQADTDFAGVRGPQSLAKLPEAERLAWQKLWAEVAGLLARTKESPLKSKEKPSKP